MVCSVSATEVTLNTEKVSAKLIPEWEEDENVSHRLKLLRLSSTTMESWSTPELRFDGVLGELGIAGMLCRRDCT